jgi:glycosyltransferase involved in cell wall biosynthesis
VDYENGGGFFQNVKTALNILYSLEAKKKIEQVIKKEKPELVHFNNFAHQISPSVLHALKKYKIPSVMTMRDFKLVCPSYSMLLNGKPCERCKGGAYYNCFLNKCTKNSRVKSLINTAEMYLHHNIMDIYSNISLFISPSRFLKNKVEEMGFKKKVVYLPNFVYAEKFTPEYNFQSNEICYFGRLSEEKGILTLVKAVIGLDIKLNVIGEGPQKDEIELLIKKNGMKNVLLLGHKTGDELFSEIKKSMAVVIPSECYENNPRTVLEAFSLGKPVIGARIGGIPELVLDDKTGICFEPGNEKDLKEKILFFSKNSEKVIAMGKNARKFVSENFNPDWHYKRLIEIYEEAKKNYFS